MITAVSATRITCDRVIDDQAGTCSSRILGDNPSLDEDAMRRGAAQYGWGTGPEGDLCPKHR